MKVKKLQVSYWWPDRNTGQKRYRVEKVIDSIDVHPGDFLTEKELTEFINSTSWNVTVVPNKS